MKKKDKKLSVRKMTITGVLGAISIMLGLTPLGFIPVGPTKATIMHIPVIIGSIVEGPIVGMLIGLIFGAFSIIQAVTNPTPISPVFYNPIVSILPRVLMGFVTYYVYDFFNRHNSKLVKGLLNLGIVAGILFLLNSARIGIMSKGSVLGIIVNLVLSVLLGLMLYHMNNKAGDVLDITMAAIVGTLINTVGVLGSIYLIYAEKFVKALGKSTEVAGKVILGVAITNGIPEIILAVVITVSVVKALKNNL